MYNVSETPFDPISEIVLEDGGLDWKGSVSLHVTVQEITDVLDAVDTVHAPEVEFEWDCTPGQVKMLGSCQPSIIRLDVPAHLAENFDGLRSAWHTLARRNQLLRTVIVKGEDENGRVKYRQRILRKAADVRLGLFANLQPAHDLSEPASLVLDWSNGSPTIYLRILAAIADRTTLGYLWKDFLAILAGDIPKPHLASSNYSQPDSAKNFWAENLGNIPKLAIHAIPVERHQVFQTTVSECTSSPFPRNFHRSVFFFLKYICLQEAWT